MIKASKRRKLRSAKPGRNNIKSRWVPWWKVLLYFAATGIILLFLLFFVVYLGIPGRIPSAKDLKNIKTPLGSEVFSADGKLLGRYYVENRSYITYEEISPDIIHALVATEDARFFKHRGIDEIALLRVFFKTILFGDRSSGGGSTLSQQIAKNLFPRNDLWIFTLPVGKMREAIIAYRLERIYSKEEILTLYLNTVPFAENIFGIEVAAERFFSKRPLEVTLPEAAVLVGMLKANHLYNPRLYPENSVQRRNVVIDQVVDQKYITPDEGKKYKALPLNLRYSLITYNQGPAPYFLEYLRPALVDWCLSHTKPDGTPYNLYSDGLRIYTTLDSKMQELAGRAVAEQMKNLQGVFDKHWEKGTPWGNDNSVLMRALKRTDRYKRGLSHGKNHEEIMKEFSSPVEITIFTWDGVKSVTTTPLDSLKHYLSMLNTGFLVVENITGAIKAWVGGNDFRFFKYDHVLSARQVGSTFKPVVYLAALENGLSPLDYFPAEQKTYEEYEGWTPGNAGGPDSGYYTMKTALARSINTVTVEIMMQTGVRSTVKTARNLGIKSKLPEVPSLALGTASIPLIEMVSSFAAIANLGKTIEPYALLEITNNLGSRLDVFEIPPTGKTRVDPENCRLIIDMLCAAVNSGTAHSIRGKFQVPGPFAGKTGTTQNYADGWFIGFTPDFTAGCWVGAEDPAIHFRNMNYGQGAFMALPTVGKFFSAMYEETDFKPYLKNRFEAPDSSMLAQINALPDFKERLDEDFGFFGIFKKKDESEKEKNREKEDRAGNEDKRKPPWEIIKEIFRKK